MTPRDSLAAVDLTRDPMAECVDLSPAAVDAVARRVVELLREAPASESAAGPLLWTTARTAQELGRSTEWVRDHRHELGVVTTRGARPRLMFDPAAVRQWATARDGVVGSGREKPASPRRLRRGPASVSGTGVDLLPVGAQEEAA
jgi:hypothetical protein